MLPDRVGLTASHSTLARGYWNSMKFPFELMLAHLSLNLPPDPTPPKKKKLHPKRLYFQNPVSGIRPPPSLFHKHPVANLSALRCWPPGRRAPRRCVACEARQVVAKCRKPTETWKGRKIYRLLWHYFVNSYIYRTHRQIETVSVFKTCFKKKKRNKI